MTTVSASRRLRRAEHADARPLHAPLRTSPPASPGACRTANPHPGFLPGRAPAGDSRVRPRHVRGPLVRLDQRIDEELAQEASELRRLAAGNDPAPASPSARDAGGLRGLPRAERPLQERGADHLPRRQALSPQPPGRAVPGRRPIPSSSRAGRLVRTDRAASDTPAGDVEYLAMPLRGEGRDARASSWPRSSSSGEDRADAAVRAAALVGLALLLLGSATRLAACRPGRAARDRARRGAVDLRDRPEHAHPGARPRPGRASSPSTFNDMLDRLERAFARSGASSTTRATS